jgi:hypothetical protein
VRVAAAIVFALTAGVALRAHALDEYVQGTRVDVTPKGVALVVDLTPGVAIAQAIVDRLDGDRDGVFSPSEAESYGRALIADLDLSLDGSPLSLSLERIEAPPAGEMREGRGTIRLTTWSDAPLQPGRHRLVLRNSHLPGMSVYLANALLPDSRDVRILEQTRDVRQQRFELDFEMTHSSSAAAGWLLVGCAVLAGLVRLRV